MVDYRTGSQPFLFLRTSDFTKKEEDTVYVLYEIIGYIGTGLIILSMMMPSVTKLRVFNVMGSLFSIAYALLIAAYPVALLNVALTVINLYHLIRTRCIRHRERTRYETEN